MRKRSVYIGLALIAIAIIVFIGAGYAVNNVGGLIINQNITAASNSIGYLKLMQGSHTFTVLYVVSTNLTNIYILNSSLFNGLMSYVDSNSSRSGYAFISSSPVNKSYVFHDNDTVRAYTTPMPNATDNSIYVVMDNTKGSFSSNRNVSGNVFYKTYNYADGLKYIAVLAVAILVFIAGLAFLAYGLIRKAPQINANEMESGSLGTTKTVHEHHRKGKKE